MADFTASAYGGLGLGSKGGTASTSTTQVAPSNKTITLGGGTHDYAFDILNDPAYKQLRDSLSAAGIGDAARLRGAIQQALIGFGSVPNLPSDVLQTTGLDTAGTQALAENNPFSTLKRLQQSYQDSQDSAKNQLAARGILNSGETGFQLGRLGQQNGQNTYDATNSLLGNIGSLSDQYTAGRQAAAQQLASGAFSAEANAAASGGGGSAGVTATWDPASGLYKDPTGAFYDANGNPVSFNAGLSATTNSTPAQAAPTPVNSVPAGVTSNTAYQVAPRNTGTFAGI